MSNNIYNDAKKLTQEMTTSADIAFEPQMGVGVPTKAEKDLLKDKSKKLNKDLEKSILSPRQKKIKEDFDKRIPALKAKIIEDLTNLIKNSNLSAGAFATTFPRHSKDITGNTALIKYQSMPQDEAKLRTLLPDDVGELELIDTAIEEKRSIRGYEPFGVARNLFGARIVAREYGVNIMYEGMLDTNFTQKEYLYVGDFDIVEKAASDIGGVTASRRFLYPVGGTFRPDFYRQLKSLIQTGGEDNVKGN